MTTSNTAARFADLVAASTAVASTRSRNEKTTTLSRFLADVAPEEIPLAISYLSGRPRQDRLGVGWVAVRDLNTTPATVSSLSLSDVDRTFAALESASGTGSNARRREVIAELFAAATAEEQDFLRRLLLRDLRQGATSGLMIEALAKAAGVPSPAMRRAAMLSGSVVTAGTVGLTEGVAGLDAIHLELLRPIQPMLASTAQDVAAAVGSFGEASVEAKLDGARIQVHRRGEDVAVFTRNLNDITSRVPEIVRLVRGLPFETVVLDGEAMSMRSDGTPHPFQVTMGRFGSEVDDLADDTELPLMPVFFDVLFVDGDSLLDEPLRERHAVLDGVTPPMRVARILTADADEAAAFLAETLASGHEGVMVKDPTSTYGAGRRGKAWLKVKPAHTLDLVVLAVEWGSGRRTGWLSNLHLGARDADGGFVMLGKTFKGLTDALLQWQTERFLELETHRKGHVVYVRPEQVVEIAFDGVQRSTRYPGGVALRFARVKGYRDDKTAAEADTIDAVRSILGEPRR